MMRTLVYIIAIGLFAVSCKQSQNESDAFGNFEATEVLVSSQQNGILENYTATEGMKLKKGEIVGITDTVQIYLKKKQLLSQKQLVLAKYSGIDKGIDVQIQQKENMNSELARVKRLLEGGAATEKQLDDVENALALVEKQIVSTQTQYSMAQAELSGINVNIESVNDQLNRCKIINPIDGIVIQNFVEKGELVITGKSLYKIANLDTLEIKAYISGAQLSQIAIGDVVTVLTDKNVDENSESTGIVTWIASEAEFTPKLIQTKEERVNLVYAIKVKVANKDGKYKIGMPGEIIFKKQQ